MMNDVLAVFSTKDVLMKLFVPDPYSSLLTLGICQHVQYFT